MKPGSDLDIFRMLIGGSIKTRADNFNFVEDGERDSGFAKFYDEKIKPKAKEFEASRLKFVKRYIWTLRLIFLIAVWPPASFYVSRFFWDSYKVNIDISFRSLIEHLGVPQQPEGSFISLYLFSLISLFFCSKFVLAQFRRHSKAKLLTEVFTFFGDFTYEPGEDRAILGSFDRLIKHTMYSGFLSHIRIRSDSNGSDEYLEFGLFKDNALDLDKKEDVISGEYKGVSLRFEEICLVKSRPTQYGSGVVFTGAVILLSSNKKFQGRTIIKKKSGGFVRQLLRSISGNLAVRGESLQKIHLEDLHFDKMFDVYSQDQIEARYLLTTSFMERIKGIADLLGAKGVEASFYNNSLLLSFEGSKDLFEIGSIFEEVTLVKECKLAVRHMGLILDVIDTLKLSEKTGL